MRNLIVAIAACAALLASPISSPAATAADSCQFVLGFKTLHDALPDVVGGCLVDEHHNPENGDGLQETAGVGGKGGLLVWRKSDNWTAYTDGFRTWINGPRGIEQRLNTERFAWEVDGAPGGASGAPANETTICRSSGSPGAGSYATACTTTSTTSSVSAGTNRSRSSTVISFGGWPAGSTALCWDGSYAGSGGVADCADHGGIALKK
jgi:hypothetical protein